MATIPGTYFTKEQLETDLKVDNVSDGGFSGSDKSSQYGFVYQHDRKQYDKALAWYILAAMENNSIAQNNIGVLYQLGLGVPKNYLCALKWYLKSIQQRDHENTRNTIGSLLENGQGVLVNKYRALEWYCRGGNNANRNRLKRQGYHRSAADKKKPLQQLIKETEAILDGQKKNLEQKQYKTQEEMESLEQLTAVYNLLDGGKDAWENVPILLADVKQPVETSIADHDNIILEPKKQTELLEQDNNTFESQAKQLQSLGQEKTNLELQIKERLSYKLNPGDSAVQHQIDNIATSLQIENQQLKLKIISLEQDVKERDSKLASVMTMIQALKLETVTAEHQVSENARVEMKRLKASLELILKEVTLNGGAPSTAFMVETQKSLLQAKTNQLLRQSTDKQLKDERVAALEKEETLGQTQNTGDINLDGSSLDDNAYNDINYDTEPDNTNDDINYDTPSEDEE